MMTRGTGWIAWDDPKDAPKLPSTKPAEKPVKERPVQEQQFGSNIDSMPIEHNAPAPAGSWLACSEKP